MNDFKDVAINKKLMKQLGVDLVVIFGSQITGSTHVKSDIDIGFVFGDIKKRKAKPVEIYGSLHEEFSKVFKLKRVDIVYLKETSIELQYKAVRDGLVIYESNESKFADYKEYVLRKYFDFKYFEDIFNKAIAETV